MNLKPLKRCATTVLIMATFICGGVLAAPSASAAVGCRNSTCYNKNPEIYGCGADAYTIGYAYASITGARYEARYSLACNAMWIRSLNTRFDEYPQSVGMMTYGPKVGQNQFRLIEWSLDDVFYAAGYTMMIPWGSSGLGSIWVANSGGAPASTSGYLNNVRVG